jgi:hypothetical protein
MSAEFLTVEPFTRVITGRAARNVVDFELSAYQLFNLRGRIAHRGIPLSGVTVDGGELGTVVTKGDGRFSFGALKERTEFVLKLSKPNFRFSSEQLSGFLFGDVDFDIVAVQLLVIGGTVKHRGRPLEGVTVDGGKLGTVTTMSDGAWMFSEVPENSTYSITFSKSGFAF